MAQALMQEWSNCIDMFIYLGVGSRGQRSLYYDVGPKKRIVSEAVMEYFVMSQGKEDVLRMHQWLAEGIIKDKSCLC